jgi:hypothetical protein
LLQNRALGRAGRHARAVSITFATARVDHRTSPGPVHRVVIGRVVMTVAGAQDLAENLFDFLAKHGLTRRPDPQSTN